MTCRRRNAFTLIELLVVISIVSLLIAVLLPALNKARALSQNIQCAANMRQIGIAIFTYANDYDQYLPGADWSVTSYDPSAVSGSTTGWVPSRWPLAAKDYLGGHDATSVGQVNLKAKVMQCPTTFFANANESYGMNRYAAGKANTNEWKYSRNGPRKLDDALVVKYSTNFLIAGESTYNNQIRSAPWGHGSAQNGVKLLHGGTWAGVYHPSRLHLDLRNFFLADGHVESQPEDGELFVINEGSDHGLFKGKIQWGQNDSDQANFLTP